MTKILNIPIEIPDNYIVDNTYKQYTDLDIDNTGLITIKIKKEIIKNWNYYINNYFNGDIRWNINTPKGYAKDLLGAGKYDDVPFEIKIGVLKYICDDLNIKLSYVLYDLDNNLTMFISNETKKIENICPSDFIDSIKIF